MPTRPRPSHARSELWLPGLSLGGCVRGAMLRDTRHVTLAPEQRFSHYPATPLCTISWYLDGEIDMLEPGVAPTLDAPRRPMASRVVFSGPQTNPNVTWNHGPGHGLMLLLLPDAIQSLTLIDPREWINRHVDVADVLPASWGVMCDSVARAETDNARFSLIEGFLDPLWQAARPRQALSAQRYSDWIQGLALRAATSRVGRSLRQVERRILQWTGQPIRELRGFGRAERAFFDMMARDESMPVDWAGLAIDHQFSDQSHLCRTSQRITGFSPAALRKRIQTEEGFWPYRIWQ